MATKTVKKTKQNVTAQRPVAKTMAKNPGSKVPVQKQPAKKTVGKALAKSVPAKVAAKAVAVSAKKARPGSVGPAVKQGKSGAVGAKLIDKNLSKLTAKELEYYRSLLLTLRESVTGNVSFLTSNNLKPMPITDENVDVNDCEFALTVAGDEQTILYEIEEALRRIDNGSYGICEQTGRPISRERLKALPYARFCIEAQSMREHGRRPRRRPDLF